MTKCLCSHNDQARRYSDEGDESAIATFNREPAKIPQHIYEDEGDEPMTATWNRNPAQNHKNADADERDTPDANLVPSKTDNVVDQHSQNEVGHSPKSHHSDSCVTRTRVTITRTLKKIAFSVIGFIAFCVDVGLDVYLAVGYFNEVE